MRPHLRGVTARTLHESAHRGPLRDSPLLHHVAADDLDTLVSGAQWVSFTRGTKLTLQGSRPGHCWLVLTGYVKEHRPLDKGSEAVSGFRGPGDLVGEVGVLMARPSAHDATGLGHGEALAFSGDHLRHLMADRPRLQSALLHAVAARATSAESTLVRNDVCDAFERVVLAILELADRWGVTTPDGVHIGIPLTQTDLAEWVGTSRETAAKALHRLRCGGLVATSRRRLIVQDLDGLRDLVGLGHPDTLAMPA